ncbi:MAG TPA: adenylate/guanylate cyclase domain-containing protein [Actinomycetota bacterium]|jgi:class 3 adenylate cyclase|nr:adenylate/guanylate cyclase domain-containing protein [Actinomycetota bacterium]
MAERLPCPRCGHENEAAQTFCGSCGTRLVLTCSACGATSPLTFRFCGTCGAELHSGSEGPRSGEERRVVSVLFADLVGFTSRAERLDPEDVRAILRPYYASLRGHIESFGGAVEKFIGDAVMGVFGAPVAHGDDPERAVRAALRIGDAVTEMNAKDPRLDLQVRMAVNTGEVIVSLDARIEEGEYMIAGDVVNTASRLQTQAPTHSILVGEETYRCTRSVIAYEPVEPVIAKGKEVPVAAWRVVGSLRQPGERGVSDVPMIGREHEMATLLGVWDRVVAAHQPHLVTIFGLPGVGKSRLASEFVRVVRKNGARVVAGRSLPYGESGAYGAFAQQVKQVADVFDGDPPEVALEKLRRTVGNLVEPEAAEELTKHLAMMLGLGTDPATTDEGVTDRHILFFSARRFVEALGHKEPTVLVFQDLHWADPSLLDLIQLLAARVEKTPLLLLTLARPELHDRRAGWGSGVPASIALPLEPLDEQHAHELTARLMAELPGQESGQSAEDIVEAGEGNPLFIEELVASVAERSSPAAGELPTSIRGIIAARLDAIPAPERSMLLNASVVGRIFWNGAVAHLDSYGDRVQELLDSLEGRDFIRREPVSRYEGQQQFRFKHMLIRDVAYATLPRAKRREAHAAVASFLEEVHADRDSPAALGYHWSEAGDRDRAADYFVAAAEQANRGWAKEEAVTFFRQALALVREEDRERYRKLRLKLAVAEQMLFHLPDAERIAHDRERKPER